MVSGQRSSHFIAEMLAGTRKLMADVSSDLGGSGSAPSPHEIFEASLVACTIITLQMYADRHNWPLESAEVRVKIDKEGAESHLLREIKLRGELSLEQKQKLFEIADKCPIHKLMTSQTSITTTAIST